jgi:hypothetical protein
MATCGCGAPGARGEHARHEAVAPERKERPRAGQHGPERLPNIEAAAAASMMRARHRPEAPPLPRRQAASRLRRSAEPRIPCATSCTETYSTTTPPIASSAARGTVRSGLRTSPLGCSAPSMPRNARMMSPAVANTYERRRRLGPGQDRRTHRERPEQHEADSGTSLTTAASSSWRRPSHTANVTARPRTTAPSATARATRCVAEPAPAPTRRRGPTRRPLAHRREQVEGTDEESHIRTERRFGIRIWTAVPPRGFRLRQSTAPSSRNDGAHEIGQYGRRSEAAAPQAPAARRCPRRRRS